MAGLPIEFVSLGSGRDRGQRQYCWLTGSEYKLEETKAGLFEILPMTRDMLWEQRKMWKDRGTKKRKSNRRDTTEVQPW